MKIEIVNRTIELSGFFVGLWVFVVIIFARRLCIWGEFNFTKKFWLVFFIFGFLGLISSLFIKNLVISTMLSVFGFIFLWGINETFEQEKRVEKGWFPKKKHKINNE